MHVSEKKIQDHIFFFNFTYCCWQSNYCI